MECIRKRNDDFFTCQSFDLASQLATSRGDSVAIFSPKDAILLNANENYLNYFMPFYNKRANIIGKKISEIFTEESRYIFNKMKDHVINTGNAFYSEETELNLIFFGKTYWNITLMPIVEEGKLKCFMGYLSNETEKVLNRQAITERNRELETVIENISDEITIFDKDFNVVTSNRKTHLTPLKNIHEIAESFTIYDEDNQLLSYGNLPCVKIARGESIAGFLIKAVRGGEETYNEVFGTPIYDDEGNFSRGIMIYRDISSRIKKEELKLMDMQNEPLTRVIESMELEYIRCAYPDLEILRINKQAIHKLKGIDNDIKSPDDVIGKSCYDLYPIDVASKKKELEYYLEKEADYSYVDYENYMVAGEERFFKTINEPIVGLNDQVVEVIFITIDITDEVKARNKMEETLELQNQMFTTISHELKTPLNVIFSAAQLIELELQEEMSQINKEDMSKGIAIIKQNCHRFTKIINNIIDLSRMESGFFKLNYRNENIVSLVEDMVDSMRAYVENAGLQIIFDTEIEEKKMAVDVNQLERIMLNLISNAVKFSPIGETIYIDIKDKGDFVLILVRDCGRGISKKHIRAIFDKYKKVDNSLSRNAEGSGIGLSLVKSIAQLIGGEISVESEFGKGSVFTVKLPVNTIDELEVTDTAKCLDNRVGQLSIEFSDIYVN